MNKQIAVIRLLIVGLISGVALLFIGQIHSVAADEQIVKRYVMLVVDQSFSVSNLGKTSIDSESLSQTLISLRSECPDCWLGAIVFGEQVMSPVDIKPFTDWTATDIDQLFVDRKLGSGTNFTEALHLATSNLTRIKGKNKAQDGDNVDLRIILLSDTQLDEDKFKGQKAALETVVRSELMTSGVQLVVIDYVPNGKNDKWWDRSLIDGTGGWYMKGDRIGADDDIVKTLMWAFAKPSDAVLLEAGREISKTFTVAPYQKRVQLVLIHSNDITITRLIPPTGVTNYSINSRNGQTQVTIDYPVEGEWSIYVTGSGGSFRLLRPIKQFPRQIELALGDTRQTQQFLTIDTPVAVEFLLRDANEKKFVISDPRFKMSAQLMAADGSVRGSLDVSFSQSCSCYRTIKWDVNGLSGKHFIGIQVTAPWLADAIVMPNPPSIFWGEVPKFAYLSKVTTPDLKIGQLFSVTTSLVNSDLVVYPLQIQIKVDGANNSQVVQLDTTCDGDVCYTEVPALTQPGLYTLTTILYGGVTKEQVSYSSAISTTSFEIRDLTLLERADQNKTLIFSAFVGTALLVVLLIRIYRRYQYVFVMIGSRQISDPKLRRLLYHNIRQEIRSNTRLNK